MNTKTKTKKPHRKLQLTGFVKFVYATLIPVSLRGFQSIS